MNETPSPKPRKLLSDARVFAAALLVAYLFLLNAWIAFVRAESRAADYAFAFVAFLSPLAIALLAGRARPRWLGIMVTSLGLLAAPLSAIGLLGSGFGYSSTVRAGKDLSFEPTSAVWQGSVRVRAYCTNGGATTDYGLCVRQERRIFPGVLLVRDLYRIDHAQGGLLANVSTGLVKVTPGANNPRSDKAVDVYLKPVF